MDFVPIVFTTSGGMGPHWIQVTRVAEEDSDEAMKIGPWVARLRVGKRKAFKFSSDLGSQIHGRGCKL
jgi:hypothetical protein